MEDAESSQNLVTVIAPFSANARLLLPDGAAVTVVNGVATVDVRWKLMLLKNGWKIPGPVANGGSPHDSSS